MNEQQRKLITNSDYSDITIIGSLNVYDLLCTSPAFFFSSHGKYSKKEMKMYLNPKLYSQTSLILFFCSFNLIFFHCKKGLNVCGHVNL